MKQLQEGQGKLRKRPRRPEKGLKGSASSPARVLARPARRWARPSRRSAKAQGDVAVGQQGRALEALRKGAQDMMQQMQQAMQGDQGGSEEGGRQQDADRDPLGRPRATTGPDLGDSVQGAGRDRCAARAPDSRSDPQAARQRAQPADGKGLPRAPARPALARFSVDAACGRNDQRPSRKARTSSVHSASRLSVEGVFPARRYQ